MSSISVFPRPAFLALAATFSLAVLAQPSASAQNSKPQGPNSQRATEKAGAASGVARGKYLVEGVAMCGQCHTPRDSQGNPDRSHWLQGSALPFMPAQPDSDWPIRAPRIGGTPPADDADMVKLLTTGIWTNGTRLRFPMPQFRMERSDAEAVVAYLKSLPSQP
ncbi:MAG: c-type cytochrome [Terriglobales bacterium]|jgi:mono/diheme cytochrome c family protein